MKNARKHAREWLETTTETQFNNTIAEMKLSPRQVEILRLRFEKYKYNYQIAMDLCLSPETVKKELAKVYDKLSKLYLL